MIENPKFDDPAAANWFCLDQTPKPLHWRLKHKPILVRMDDGTTFMQIHPDDAHVFAEDDK